MASLAIETPVAPGPQAKDGEYILHNDAEMDRLDQQHPVMVAAIGGYLVMPDIDLSGSGRRILDSGTADGIWIRDLASKLGPNNEYVGIDINPEVFPKESPKYIKYVNQDINKPWPAEWEGTFDLVHQRLTLLSAGGYARQAIAGLLKLVKSGGWIMLVEAEQVPSPDDGPAMHQTFQVMTDLFNAIGAGTSYARDMETWVREAGFVDVHAKSCKMQGGPKNPDKKLGKQAAYSSSKATQGLVGFIQSFPPGTTSVPVEELNTLGARVQEEQDTQGGDWPMRVVWARKP